MPRRCGISTLATVLVVAGVLVRPVAAGADSAQARLSLDLSTAITMALENNARAITARADVAIEKLNANSARSQFDPRLVTSTGISRVDPNSPVAVSQRSNRFTTTMGLEGSSAVGLDYSIGFEHGLELQGDQNPPGSNLWIGRGSLALQLLRNSAWQQLALLRGADATLDVAESAAAQVRQELALDVASAYLTYLQAAELVGIAEKAQKLADDQLALTKRLVTAGLANRYETAQPEAALAERTARVALAKRDLVGAEAALLQLLFPQPESGWNASLEVSAVPLPEELPESLTHYTQAATESHPVLGAARSRLAAARHDLRRRRMDRLPNLAVEFRGQTSTLSATEPAIGLRYPFSYFVGMTLSQPLGGGVARDEKGRSVERLRSVEGAYRQAVHNIFVDVRRAHAGVGFRLEALGWFVEARDKARTALDVERRSYQKGRSTGFNVLRTQERLIAAETDLVTAQRDFKFSYVELWFATGRLITELAASQGT